MLGREKIFERPRQIVIEPSRRHALDSIIQDSPHDKLPAEVPLDAANRSVLLAVWLAEVIDDFGFFLHIASHSFKPGRTNTGGPVFFLMPIETPLAVGPFHADGNNIHPHQWIQFPSGENQHHSHE